MMAIASIENTNLTFCFGFTRSKLELRPRQTNFYRMIATNEQIFYRNRVFGLRKKNSELVGGWVHCVRIK